MSKVWKWYWAVVALIVVGLAVGGFFASVTCTAEGMGCLGTFAPTLAAGLVLAGAAIIAAIAYGFSYIGLLAGAGTGHRVAAADGRVSVARRRAGRLWVAIALNFIPGFGLGWWILRRRRAFWVSVVLWALDAAYIWPHAIVLYLRGDWTGLDLVVALPVFYVIGWFLAGVPSSIAVLLSLTG